MSITERAQRRVRSIVQRFPGEIAQIARPERDAYGSETGGETPVGTATVWRNALAKPTKYQVAAAGQVYEDDGAIWVTALSPAPDVRHEDRITIAGEAYTVRNILNDTADARVFWQIAKRE